MYNYVRIKETKLKAHYEKYYKYTSINTCLI